MNKVIQHILIILPFLSNGQTNAIFNSMEFEYKGEIDSVLIETFKPINKGDKIVDYRYEGGLFGAGTQKIFFDEAGKVHRKYEYTTYCGGSSIRIDKIWNYYYTKSKIDSVIRSESDTSLIRKRFPSWKFYYTYESDSIMYETQHLTFKSIRRIKKRKNQVIREYFNRDSIVYTVEISSYDTLGRLVKFEVFNKDKLSELTILNYSDSLIKQSNLIHRIVLSTCQVYRTENEINQNGDIIKTTEYKPDGTYWTHWSFKYKYDEKGNWIKKEQYNYQEKMLKMYKQTIQYKSNR